MSGLEASIDRAKQAARDAVELERKIREAYAVALRHCHDGGSIQVHVGADVVEHLKNMATREDPTTIPDPAKITPAPRLFGFPLIPADEELGRDHISVHVVHHIF